jgi:hypothetical protein
MSIIGTIRTSNKNIKDKIPKKQKNMKKAERTEKKTEKLSESRIFLLKAEEVAGLITNEIFFLFQSFNKHFLFYYKKIFSFKYSFINFNSN